MNKVKRLWQSTSAGLWLIATFLLAVTLAATTTSWGLVAFLIWLWVILTVTHHERLSVVIALICLAMIPALRIMERPALAQPVASVAYALLFTGLLVQIQHKLLFERKGHAKKINLQELAPGWANLPAMAVDLLILVGAWYIVQGWATVINAGAIELSQRPAQDAAFTVIILICLALFQPSYRNTAVDRRQHAQVVSGLLLLFLCLAGYANVLIQVPLLRWQPVVLFLSLSWLLLFGRRMLWPWRTLRLYLSWLSSAATLLILGILAVGFLHHFVIQPALQARLPQLRYDLIGEFPAANINQGTGISLEQWSASGETLSVLSMQPPSRREGRIEYTFILPPEAILTFRLALKSAEAGMSGETVTFRVEAGEAAETEVIFEQSLISSAGDVTMTPPISLDLSLWGGQQIKLRLINDYNTHPSVVPGWVLPRIVSRAAEEADQPR